ncbi:MAG: (2Fe-2S)-binding protein [Methylococcales bacterium]|nr:(2Fe-2S)-binding protein [Methylococcales bacterium]
MYVCICNEVTDKAIKHATDSGISSMKDLQNSLNVGTSCGRCSSCAKKLLKEYLSSTVTMELNAI